ncbi:MAG: penicillin acylase family protein, partial [Cyclobacteriaceae bacterium]
PVNSDYPDSGLPDSSYINVLTRESMKMPNPYNGSNSFVVGPQKTTDGSVILSNEPDLALNLPSIWYVAHLSTGDLNTMGATIPGMPGVIIGFNENIAWGNTNAPRDLVDWYQISFKNDKREEYRYDDKWLKAENRIEKYKVSGGETFYDTVIYTHYGPVAYDRNFMGNGEQVNLAMRWTAHDPSVEFKAMYQINRANNYEEFVKAFDYFDGPPQNYSYGDRQGNIALWINGKYPIKWKEQGKFVLNGANSSHEWMGFIPREQNIHIKNPDRGFVSSANQHPADSTYPYYIYDRNYEYYRGRRLNDRLRTMENVSVRDVQKLQNDNYNYIASENLDFLLNTLDSASLDNQKSTYFRLLRNWDYFNDPNMVAPSVFELWQDRLIYLLWDEFRKEDISLRTPPIYHTFHYLQNNDSSEFFDNLETASTETAADLISQSYKFAVDSIESWQNIKGSEAKWYLFKNTTISHMLGIEQFSVDKVKIGGNHNIINAASSGHGPSWRMVVKLTKGGIEAWGMYPGSQTGNVGNPKYGHWIEDWSQGKYTKLEFSSRSKFPADKILKTIKFASK